VVWFADQIETFAPATWYDERQSLYAELIALPSDQVPSQNDPIGLFVLSQVVAAHQLTRPALDEKPRRDRSAHDNWYSKERNRIAKLLQQIDESPVVSSFHATVHYYVAEEVTCPHGRNQKTCDALYALRLTLDLLERYPALPGVRKQVERLRHLEPHLPSLTEVCRPQRHAPFEEPLSDMAMVASTADLLTDECALYLLGTVVGRLRQVGLTVAQSCDVVDRLLTLCFDQPDAAGNRSALLAEQWRRLC
jgi:hypothetical protein